MGKPILGNGGPERHFYWLARCVLLHVCMCVLRLSLQLAAACRALGVTRRMGHSGQIAG